MRSRNLENKKDGGLVGMSLWFHIYVKSTGNHVGNGDGENEVTCSSIDHVNNSQYGNTTSTLIA